MIWKRGTRKFRLHFREKFRPFLLAVPTRKVHQHDLPDFAVGGEPAHCGSSHMPIPIGEGLISAVILAFHDKFVGAG
jgi:hypothetical protein